MGGTGGAAPAGGIDIAYGPSGIKGLAREPYILGLACFASIGGVLYGYDQGVISGVLVMSDFAKTFPLLASDSVLQGWMVAVLTLGAMCGALANGPLADRVSRRWAILLANIIFLIGSVIQAAAVNIPMIFVGRFIAGVSVGQLSMGVPLYISELAPPNLRGSLVTLQQLGITIGILIAFWLEYGTQYIGGTGESQSPAAWRLPLALQCLPSVILAIGTFFLPYSPRWLMMKDREGEALAALSRIRRVSSTDPRIKLELLEIKAVALFDKETTEAMYPGVTSPVRLVYETYKLLLVTRHLNRRLFISCLLQLVGQFSGINAIIYYAPQIFELIGLDGNSVSLLATGVVGVINCIFTLPAIFFMDKVGRKRIIVTGALGMGVSQIIVASIYAVYEDSWATHRNAGWATAVFIWVYIACFAFSLGCVIWVIPSEIFPPFVRSQAVGVSIGCNWLCNFIVALITPRMLERISFGTFYFFSAFCIFLVVWVWFWVPETKGVRIEEMDVLFGGNQGEEDMQRIADIRRRLGISEDGAVNMKKDDVGDEQVERP